VLAAARFLAMLRGPILSGQKLTRGEALFPPKPPVRWSQMSLGVTWNGYGASPTAVSNYCRTAKHFRSSCEGRRRAPCGLWRRCRGVAVVVLRICTASTPRCLGSRAGKSMD